MLNHVFETLMDTIWNSISVLYMLEFVFLLVLGSAILGQVMDLVGYTEEEDAWTECILFGYEVAY